MVGVHELEEQARFAHARLAHDRDDLALSRARLGERALHLGDLVLPADEMGQSARPRSVQAAAQLGGAGELVDLYRMWHALDRHRPERLHRDVAFGKPQRVGGETHRAGGRELLHASGKVCGLADRRVVHLQVAADGAHHHGAGIEPDANLHFETVARP